MKWKLSFSITGILLHLAAFTFAQSSNQNYVQTETMLTENGEHKITTIEYCDGLGRPYLTATTGLNTAGTTAYSLKTLMYPNNAVEEWLPGISDQAIEWKEASDIRQLSKETNVESNPFRSITYDVLGRELYSLGVGDKWHSANKYSSIQRFTNVKSGVAKLTVKQYRANKNNDIVENGVWETGSLSAEQTMDEDNKGMIVFTDFHGQKILERRFSGTDKYNDTYFVYNDYGLLSYVLTPMFQKEKSLGKYAYKYLYDTQNRLISKCLPGCEPIRYWYDDEDRLVFVQDNELQIKGKCRFMFYDVKGRVVLQGLCSNQPSNCLSGIAITQTKGLFDTGFSNPSTLQLVSPEFEAVYYYDNYDFFNVPAFSNYGYVNQMKKTANTNAMGLQTGSIVMASNGEKLYRVNYYTEKGLAYDTRQSMLEGKLLLSRSNYSFTDNPLRTVYELCQGARIDSIVFENRYNQNNDALMSTTISYNGAPACSVSTLEYDKLGRLVKNTLPNKAGNIEYEYDIRNAVTKIQSNTYSEAIGYEGLYNGNIASTENFYGDYEEAGSYAYEYDVLNRMTKATFSNNNKYSEEADYDDNSNILHLKRWGKHNDGNYKKIDDLTYSYLGNQLSNIEDKAGQLVYDGSFDFKESGTSENYAYNTNGSMTFDPNKGLTIDYSDMGHPKKMTFNNGNTTEYTYSIEGEKLKVEWNTANTTTNRVEYVGPFILKDGKLDAFLFSGGIATIANNQATFHFYIKDHLGSNRIVVSEDGTIKQKLYYYPFGGLYGDVCVNPEFQRYKYNGKEYDHQHGLDLLDYGARMYNPVIGGWHSIDPSAEKYYHLSPYCYCGNNPINAIDLDGRDWYKNNKTSYYTWHEGNSEREGFSYIGGKGMLLGEFEPIIDNILCGKDGLGLQSLYTNGFSLDITPNDKGALIGSKERGWDFFDEFINGVGPEFSVILSNHPYTQEIMKEEFVKKCQNVIKTRGKKGKYTNVGRPEFFPWQADPFSPMQFVGTYRYDGYSSKNGKYINNVVTDTKSVTSLIYHIPFFNNHRRSQNRNLGNTYQFYIWRTKK
nr:RHS repeat-associated core domain-containing protein [Prevotella sp.]